MNQKTIIIGVIVIILVFGSTIYFSRERYGYAENALAKLIRQKLEMDDRNEYSRKYSLCQAQVFISVLGTTRALEYVRNPNPRTMSKEEWRMLQENSRVCQ